MSTSNGSEVSCPVESRNRFSGPYRRGSRCPNAARHQRIHRSILSVFPGLITGIFISAVLFELGSQSETFFGFTLSVPIGGVDTDIALPVALLILLVTISRPLLLMLDERHELRCQRLRSITGICSLKKEEVEIPYVDILGVRTSETLIDRLLGIGTVIAWTSVGNRPEIKMEGVRHPEQVVDMVGLRIQEALHELPSAASR